MVENQALYERVGYVEYARRHELGLDRDLHAQAARSGRQPATRSPV